MNAVSSLTHAYRQAPWRIHRRWAGAFLLGVVSLALIAALYLDVTARTAILGREIQALTDDIERLRQENATLQTRLAKLLSARVMEQRARDLGYRPVKSAEIHYLIVPGYVPPIPTIQAGPDLSVQMAKTLPPEYRQSLLEWLMERFDTLFTAGFVTGATP